MQNNPNKVVQLHIEVHTDVRVTSKCFITWISLKRASNNAPLTGQEYEGMEEGISYVAKADAHGSLSLTIMFLDSTCELCVG
jgi:hypothetical protein